MQEVLFLNYPEKCLSNILLKTSSKGDSKTSLRRLFHCPTFLTGSCFLIFNLNIFSCSFTSIVSCPALYHKGNQLFSSYFVTACIPASLYFSRQSLHFNPFICCSLLDPLHFLYILLINYSP